MLGKIKGWAEDARRWAVLWLMKAALNVHQATFFMLCKLTVMDIAMKQEGIERFIVEEDADGNTRLTPVHHNRTRH